MRKLLVLPIILTAFVADFSAVGATARGGRSIANATNSATNTANTTNTTNTATNTAQQQTTANAPVAARAARNRKAPAVNNGGGTVSARAATRTSVARSAKSVAAPKIQQPTVQQQPTGKPGVAARAAKKAVNMGTAIKTAAENTIMPKECQDAYYGCMDAFCMVENMSGGRCRCDDRSEELDKVLDTIMKVDEQSKILAEDGLERLQRGMAVDEINAMAEEAAQKVRDGQKGNKKLFDDKEIGGKKKAKKDYSSQLNALFSQSNVFDTGAFGGGEEGELAVLDSDMSDKTGNALKNAAASMCINKVPTQCREYSQMLQLGYSNQIGNDCRAYENDLKQRKMNSENLLRTAQKTLRDAAAEAYENANKYDLGGCVVEYRKCMIGEDACGAGFSKCVVNKAVLSEKASTTPIDTGVATIEVELTTLNEVTAKKIHCESVLNQCQKVKDKVWDEFLKSVASELKSAEFAAEDDQRRNCAKNIVSCIREAAKTEGHQEGSDSWAIYTGNFKNFQETCKIQIQQCESYSGNLASGIENYIKSALDALRADRCTTAIKKCLESENACHEDYSNCVGVGMQKIWNMCADIVKPDCEGKKEMKNGQEVDVELAKYVSQVAAGVMQNMDDKWAEYCKKTLESVMSDACGGTDSCPKAQTIPDTVISEEVFELAICPIDHADSSIDNTTCVKSVNVLTADQATNKKVVYINRIGWLGRGTGAVQLDGTTFKFAADTNKGLGDRIAKMLNDFYKIKYNEITNNETLKKCTEGSSAKDFNNQGLKGSDNRQFTNLTKNIDKIIAQGIYDAFNTQVSTIQETFLTKVAEETAKLAELSNTMTDAKRLEICKEFAKSRYVSTALLLYKDVSETIDAQTHKCFISWRYQSCSERSDDGKSCKTWGAETPNSYELQL